MSTVETTAQYLSRLKGMSGRTITSINALKGLVQTPTIAWEIETAQMLVAELESEIVKLELGLVTAGR